VRILTAVGKWMARTESRFTTRRLPAGALELRGLHRKGNTLYMHVYFWPGDHGLAGLMNQVKSPAFCHGPRSSSSRRSSACASPACRESAGRSRDHPRHRVRRRAKQDTDFVRNYGPGKGVGSHWLSAPGTRPRRHEPYRAGPTGIFSRTVLDVPLTGRLLTAAARRQVARMVRPWLPRPPGAPGSPLAALFAKRGLKCREIRAFLAHTAARSRLARWTIPGAGGYNAAAWPS